jgi:hypothetical protein
MWRSSRASRAPAAGLAASLPAASVRRDETLAPDAAAAKSSNRGPLHRGRLRPTQGPFRCALPRNTPDAHKMAAQAGRARSWPIIMTLAVAKMAGLGLSTAMADARSVWRKPPTTRAPSASSERDPTSTAPAVTAWRTARDATDPHAPRTCRNDLTDGHATYRHKLPWTRAHQPDRCRVYLRPAPITP